MNSYYVMIRFDGACVNGFFAPQANNEEHALKQIKKLLVAQIILAREQLSNDSPQHKSHNQMSLNRLKSYYKSLKRPWRKVKRELDQGQRAQVVRIINWPLPMETGYWLSMVGNNTHLCNLSGADWEPRPKNTD